MTDFNRRIDTRRGIKIAARREAQPEARPLAPSERHRLIRGTSWTLVSTVVGIVIAVVSQPILVAFVGVDGYGVWASTIAIASLFSLGGDLGVASALPKLIAERRGRGQDEGTLAGSALLFALFTGSIAAGALAMCAPLVAGFVNFPNLTLLLRIQSLQMPFNFALGSLLALLQGGRNFRAYSLAATTLAVANLTLMAVFLLLGTGLPGVIAASLLATVGVFALMIFVYRKSVPFQGLSAFRRDIAVLVPFGVQLTLSIILSQIMYQIDLVLLSLWLRDPHVVGMYALGVFVTRLLWIIPGGISLTTYPVVSQYSAGREDRRLSAYIRTVLVGSIAVTGVLAAGIILLGRPALRIAFGSDAVPSYGLCLALLPGAAALGSVRSIAPAIPGAGRPDVAAWISGAGAALTLLLCLLLTAAVGAVGTAIGVSASFVFVSLALIWATQKFVVRAEARGSTFRRALPVALGVVVFCLAAVPFAAAETDSRSSLIAALVWCGGSGLLLLMVGIKAVRQKLS